jgi:hypothetical protein
MQLHDAASASGLLMLPDGHWDAQAHDAVGYDLPAKTMLSISIILYIIFNLLTRVTRRLVNSLWGSVGQAPALKKRRHLYLHY